MSEETISVSLEWQPRDLWVGAYWRTGFDGPYRTFDLWICLLPCLPIHFHRETRHEPAWA